MRKRGEKKSWQERVFLIVKWILILLALAAFIVWVLAVMSRGGGF